MSDLGAIFERQRRLQKTFHGRDPEFFSPEEKMQYITACAYALIDEVGEATDETGWKPWASSNHINRDAYKGELVDALHFFVNLCLVAGISAEEIIDGYFAKASKNEARQVAGYDGVTGKCSVCKRALDDDAVLCTTTGCVLGESEALALDVRVHDHAVNPGNGFDLDSAVRAASPEPAMRRWVNITYANSRPTWVAEDDPNVFSHDAGMTMYRREGDTGDWDAAQ